MPAVTTKVKTTQEPREKAEQDVNSQTNVLDNYSVADIQTAAQEFPSVPIVVSNGKILLPDDKKSLKEVLHFLLERV